MLEISTVYNPPNEVCKNCFREHKKYKKSRLLLFTTSL